MFIPLLDAPGPPEETSLVIAVQGTHVTLLDAEPATPAIFLGTLAGRHCWAVDADADTDADAEDENEGGQAPARIRELGDGQGRIGAKQFVHEGAEAGQATRGDRRPCGQLGVGR
jgi:hypothetical protein